MDNYSRKNPDEYAKEHLSRLSGIESELRERNRLEMRRQYEEHMSRLDDKMDALEQEAFENWFRLWESEEIEYREGREAKMRHLTYEEMVLIHGEPGDPWGGIECQPRIDNCVRISCVHCRASMLVPDKIAEIISCHSCDNEFFVDTTEDWEEGVKLKAKKEAIDRNCVRLDRQIARMGKGSSAGGGDAGCFIATAAFDDAMASEVVILRAWRDRFLATNSIGRIAIRAYYKASPPIASWISSSNTKKGVARLLLRPFIATARAMNASSLVKH